MKVAIVDDLREDQKMLNEYTKRYAEEKALIAETEVYSSGESFLKQMENGKYRLIFLDIYLEEQEGMDGMEVAREIRKTDPDALIVFCTASPDFAIEGYSVHACGYLLKPYEYQDFCDSLDHVSDMLAKDTRFIEVKEKREFVKVLLSDILYCDYDNHYIQIHTMERVIRSYMPFRELAAKLEEDGRFLECYRNIIVNMDYVQSAHSNEFVMENQERIPLRRPERVQLRQIYAEYVFRKMKGGEALG